MLEYISLTKNYKVYISFEKELFIRGCSLYTKHIGIERNEDTDVYKVKKVNAKVRYRLITIYTIEGENSSFRLIIIFLEGV